MEDILIDMNSTLELDQVKKILTQYIEECTGKKICEIVPLVKDNKVTGFTINYESEPATYYAGSNEKNSRPTVIDKTFRPMVFY
jgi:hypothetical protein